MEKSVDLVVISDCVSEAEALCDTFEDAGLATAMALGPVSAAQTIRLVRPRLVLIVPSRLAGDDASAAIGWLRSCSEGCIFACLIEADSPKGSVYYKDAGFDFGFRLPLADPVVRALAESVKAVRALTRAARPVLQPRAPVIKVDIELPVFG